MGDAGVVLPKRAASVLWNPAAAAFLDRYEFSAEGADLYSRLSQHGCFAGTVPLKNNIGAALSYQPFHSGRILLYDSIPEAVGFNGLTVHDDNGWFKNFHHLVSMSLARSFNLHLPRRSGTDLPLPLDISAGSNLKAYVQTMNIKRQSHMGMGYNVDVGLQVRIGLDYDIREKKVCRELFVGATLRDVLPSDVIWIYQRDDTWMYSPDSYREPFSFAQYYGVAFVDRSGDLFANWTVALSLHKEYDVTYHGGIEAEFWDLVSFRAGFSHRTPTLGAGVHYRRLFIDYALRFDEIAISFVRLTTGIVFPAIPK